MGQDFHVCQTKPGGVQQAGGIYHFRCAAGDECNGTLHYKAAGAAADQPFFIL